jgi:hypothetical protein
MKNEKRIQELREKRKRLGMERCSCANLGRGVTDSILRKMNDCDAAIRELER